VYTPDCTFYIHKMEQIHNFLSLCNKNQKLSCHIGRSIGPNIFDARLSPIDIEQLLKRLYHCIKTCSTESKNSVVPTTFEKNIHVEELHVKDICFKNVCNQPVDYTFKKSIFVKTIDNVQYNVYTETSSMGTTPVSNCDLHYQTKYTQFNISILNQLFVYILKCDTHYECVVECFKPVGVELFSKCVNSCKLV